MDGTPMVLLLLRNLREESKSHGIVGISYRESLRFPEKPSSGRNKCLAKYHWENSQPSQ
jgi:hypothetical protein